MTMVASTPLPLSRLAPRWLSHRHRPLRRRQLRRPPPSTSPSAAAPSSSRPLDPASTSRNYAAGADARRSRGGNADPREVDKFSSFASRWWDSRSNPLVGMNPVRVRFMRDAVAELSPPAVAGGNAGDGGAPFRLPFRGKRVLDVGCGGGLLTESFARLGASLAVGLDASPEVAEAARRHSFHENSDLASADHDLNEGTSDNLGGRRIAYIGGRTIEEFASDWLTEREREGGRSTTTSPQPNHPSRALFDIVTALEVIEHVPNPASLLCAATSLLKPDGILFVSTINRTWKSYGVAIIGAEYVSGKVPVGTHDWNKFWSPGEVDRMVCGAGAATGSRDTRMERVALSGMVVNPLSMEWSLDAADVDVNWIGAYRKMK